MDFFFVFCDYVIGKFECVVDKYVYGCVEVLVVFSVEKFCYIVNFIVQIKNFMVKGDYSSEDMYSFIDLVFDKIECQLCCYKDCFCDYKFFNVDKGMFFCMSVVVLVGEEFEIEEEFVEDFENYLVLEFFEEFEVFEVVEEDFGEFVMFDGFVGVVCVCDYEVLSMCIEEVVF